MKKLIFVLLALLSAATFSQDGSPDTSFGNNGVVETPIFIDSVDYVNGVVESINNKLIVFGKVYNISQGTSGNFIISYLEEGAIDTAFGDNGFVINNAEIQEEYFFVDNFINGELLIGGKVAFDPPYFLKYSESGVLDVNFGNDGILTPISNGSSSPKTLITPNGKILFSGKTEGSGASEFYLEQYNADGTLDINFGNNGIITYPFAPQGEFNVSSLIVYGDWYLLSLKETINNEAANYLVRFSDEGTLDENYGDSGFLSVPIEAEYACYPIVIPGQDVIYLNCNYYDEPQDEFFFKMAKLNANGSLDTSFGDGGYQTDRRADIIQPNGRILDMEISVDWEGGIVTDLFRYYGSGAMDSNFDYSQNYTELEHGVFLILRNSGKLLVASTSAWYNGNEDVVLMQYNNSPLSVSEFNLNALKIYPNPSSDTFVVQRNRILATDIPYQITDISGKQIMAGTLSALETTIDLSSVKSGIYFMNTAYGSARLIKN